jgi:hypothetical protein
MRATVSFQPPLVESARPVRTVAVCQVDRSVQIHRLLESGSETASNHAPSLSLAVVADETVEHGRRVQRLLDVALLEGTGRDPSAQRPRCAVSVSFRPPGGATWRSSITLAR